MNAPESPFPGMNPYLEQAQLWHQVHNRLIIAIADALSEQVAPQYLVAIEERVYAVSDESLSGRALVGIADVSLSRSNAQAIDIAGGRLTVPRPVRVPIPEEVTERFLEVRLTKTGEVVSVIELLSPKNKRSKEGRAAYESKRQKILGSATSLVEIDLLRGGEAMPLLDVTDSSYRILVSRSFRRPDADLYPFGLREPIPSIPVPLRAGEPEPVVDLQVLLNQVYQRARFDLAIDYSEPLKPALSPEDAAWVEATLRQANLVGDAVTEADEA
jgi:Protein of unknown function (DUF4058)